VDQPVNPPRAVHVTFRDGKWVVHVFDDDHSYEQEFGLEAHASAYADDERIRLGIYVP
jgi:hypothetical protein